MFNNPEVALNKNQPHLTVPRQVIKLKEITQRILSAVNGADSNRIDLEETSGEGSGSGVGSGSGDGSGSGSGRPVTFQPTTMPSTTEFDNNVEEARTTPRRVFETSTMGNNIPAADNTHNGNDIQKTDDTDDTNNTDNTNNTDDTQENNDTNNPQLQKSRHPNSANSLTESFTVCLLLLTISMLFISK